VVVVVAVVVVVVRIACRITSESVLEVDVVVLPWQALNSVLHQALVVL